MALELSLSRIQRWMQAVIVHPGTTDQAIAADEAAAEVPKARIGDVILPSKSLTSSERIGIYQGMYLLRMEEALAADYPALKQFLGEESFRELVAEYVKVYPSRSYSLNPLGNQLPEFLKTAPGRKRSVFCVELARLELAITEVFDERETPPLSEAEITAVPAEAWEESCLLPIAAFRLLSFRYDVNAYLQTVRDKTSELPKMRQKTTWLALYRRDYRIYRLALARPAHALLADLAAGVPLGKAIAAASTRGGRPPREEELFRWFREWMSGGVFQSIALR